MPTDSYYAALGGKSAVAPGRRQKAGVVEGCGEGEGILSRAVKGEGLANTSGCLVSHVFIDRYWLLCTSPPTLMPV